jgi:subtilisin family serine protease
MNRLARAPQSCAVRACLQLLLILCAASTAAAQQLLVDPALQRLLLPEVGVTLADVRVDPADPVEAHPFGGALSLDADAFGRIRVGVFLEIESPDALSGLRALGVEIGTVVDGMATARVPLDVLDAVLEQPRIRQIRAARMLRPAHDSSMIAIGAHTIRQHGPGGWTGGTGAGAIVGVIDTGLDIRHADFLDDAGGTRVVALWDQTQGSTPPPGFFYGLLCTRDAIQRVIDATDLSACPTQDQVGHGTHVAGSAVGNGAAGSLAVRYAGVAPEAELLIVKAGNVTFPEDRVADGLVWLRDEARARGRPAVVNFSFGHQYGPHDGTTFLERFIDSLSDPGFIVVLAAGNEGENRNTAPLPTAPPRLIHARVQPAAGVTQTVEFQITPYTPNLNRCQNVFVELSLWYEVRDRIEVTVVRPNGTQLTVPAGETGIANNQQGRIEISNAAPLQLQRTTAEAYIQLNGCPPSGVPAPGTWRIRLRSLPDGPVSGVPADLYLLAAVLGPGANVYGTTGFDNRLIVSSPATARRGIAVGAFTTRVCWPSLVAAETCYTNRPQIGDIAPFSVAGPTRDGRLKPEITAPGMGVISSLSRHVSPPFARVAPDSVHWVLEGTSMAAPHVAGAIAVMLQHRPTLSPEDVRQVFSRSARADIFTQRVYDPSPESRPSDWWGFGKLDVPAALQVLLGGGAIVAVRLEPPVDTIPLGGYAQLRATAVDETGASVFASFEWVSLNPAVATVDAVGRVAGLQLGAADIVVRSGAAADTTRVVVAPPAILHIAAQPLAPGPPVTAPAGTVLPLLRLEMRTAGPEDVILRSLGFELTGIDPDARLLLLDDAADDDGAGAAAAIVAAADVALDGTPHTVILSVDTVIVPRNSTRHFVAALQLSGAAPTGSTFTARLLPEATHTINTNSRLVDRVQHGDIVGSGAAVTTVLREGELFALSANPVRGDDVNFVFAAPPTLAAIYTATGSRVANLLPRINGLSHRWDLRNDSGERVVPGVYILVFRVEGRVVRQRLFVLSPLVRE